MLGEAKHHLIPEILPFHNRLYPGVHRGSTLLEMPSFDSDDLNSGAVWFDKHGVPYAIPDPGISEPSFMVPIEALNPAGDPRNRVTEAFYLNDSMDEEVGNDSFGELLTSQRPERERNVEATDFPLPRPRYEIERPVEHSQVGFGYNLSLNGYGSRVASQLSQLPARPIGGGTNRTMHAGQGLPSIPAEKDLVQSYGTDPRIATSPRSLCSGPLLISSDLRGNLSSPAIVPDTSLELHTSSAYSPFTVTNRSISQSAISRGEPLDVANSNVLTLAPTECFRPTPRPLFSADSHSLSWTGLDLEVNRRGNNSIPHISPLLVRGHLMTN